MKAFSISPSQKQGGKFLTQIKDIMTNKAIIDQLKTRKTLLINILGSGPVGNLPEGDPILKEINDRLADVHNELQVHEKMEMDQAQKGYTMKRKEYNNHPRQKETFSEDKNFKYSRFQDPRDNKWYAYVEEKDGSQVSAFYIFSGPFKLKYSATDQVNTWFSTRERAEGIS